MASACINIMTIVDINKNNRSHDNQINRNERYKQRSNFTFEKKTSMIMQTVFFLTVNDALSLHSFKVVCVLTGTSVL